MKITLPLEISIKCKSKCSNCKWKQKPSTCSPWDDWRVENKIPNDMFHYMVARAEDYFGVVNLIIEEND